MAEGGEGMLVTAGDWWYINMQKLLETSSSPEIPVNSAGWWNSQIQQLYASFKMSGNLDDNGEHWWNINIQNLLKAANYGSGIPVNSGRWWYSEIKQLLYNFDLIDKRIQPTYHESEQQEIDVDSGYLWYHQIQQLLFAAGKTRQSYDSNWRKKQILKIHQNCNSFEWQGNLVDSGQDWWKRQLNLIEDNSDDSRHKWYSQLQQLLYDFDFKGMEVHFEKLLCEVLAATAKGHLDSVKLLANVLEPIEDSNLKIAEATKVLIHLKMQLEGFSLRDLLQCANVVDNEDKLYQALIDAADQIFVVRLLLENCISLGGMQILQEAAYRQLVVIMGLELFLETFIEGGKCCVILEDSPKARHGASIRQLVSVRRLPLPLVTNIKQGMRVKFENSNQEWLKAADRHLVSVKRVRQLLETFISQEMLLNEYSWKQVLQQEFRSNYYTELSKFISEERKTNGVYPPENQVFNWTKFCRINDVKVVIFGQDPYTHPGEAHGKIKRSKGNAVLILNAMRSVIL